MLTLANLAVALAGTALFGSVAAAPAAPEVTTAVVITNSQDALVPTITVTETYTNAQGSLTTDTITIYAFSKEQAENIAPLTSSAADDAEAPKLTSSVTPSLQEPVPQNTAHGPPGSVDGLPIYTNKPHHTNENKPSGLLNKTSVAVPVIEIPREVQTPVYGLPTSKPYRPNSYNPVVPQSNMAPVGPRPAIADEIYHEAYGLLFATSTRLLTGQPPHETRTHHHKTGKSSVHHHHQHRHSASVTEGAAEAMHTVGPEGSNSK